MAYTITHASGAQEPGSTTSRFDDLLDELNVAHDEHPDVAVTHESEWCVSVYRSGDVVLENLADGDPVHATGLSRDEICERLRLVATGDIDALRNLNWSPGYPPDALP